MCGEKKGIHLGAKSPAKDGKLLRLSFVDEQKKYRSGDRH